MKGGKKVLLETTSLSKVYTLGSKQIHALRNADCCIEQGSWTTICGPSGSGKSSLLSLLATLDRPTSGKVLFNGEDISFASDVRQAVYRRETIGIVFQEYRLFEQVTAWENVAMPLQVTAMGRRQRQEKALTLLDQVGLAERAQHLPRQLSGGERQRVALARSLVHDPQILFADEPTANIDRDTARRVMELFAGLKAKGKTVIVVSHDPEMAGLADRVLTMEKGRLQA